MHARQILIGLRASTLVALSLLPRSGGSGESAMADWPQLPTTNAAAEIPAQAWKFNPGPRSVRVQVVYPKGKIENVTHETGVMLTLHNWGGEDCAGTASPTALADRLNVVAVCVNYLQSGRKASIEDPEPYDFGYMQALDALRALWWVHDGLQRQGRPFDAARTYCTGGSGGGNVTQMAAKLAPRTFACIIDMCGMKKLTHDIAFNLPGGSGLDARWSRDPTSKYFLSVDEQELRYIGHPSHLRERQKLGSNTKIIIVHGIHDHTCPFVDARESAANMQAAGLNVETNFIAESDIDGKVFTSTGHALGNRTEIVFRVAGKYLSPESDECLRTPGMTDFERRNDLYFRTTNGRFVVSYQSGFPIGSFEPDKPVPSYADHQDLSYFLDGNGRHPIETLEDWQRRRGHILAYMELAMGKRPGVTFECDLDVKLIQEVQAGDTWRRKITYQADPYDRVSAYLFVPQDIKPEEQRPAVLCLHQTSRHGKDEVAGLAGNGNMKYAMELAHQGYIVLAPDYPSLGEHAYNFGANPEYASGTMKAIWDNIRGVDFLKSLPYVDANRIGAIGHSLGGHNAIFTAAFDPRIKVTVSSCGFTRFHRDDVPSWSGPRYMPRISTEYGNVADRLPFDFAEVVACLAPRPLLVIAATEDKDFDVTGVREVVKSARIVYELLDQPSHLVGEFTEGPHDFPDAMRQRPISFSTSICAMRSCDSVCNQ